MNDPITEAMASYTPIGDTPVAKEHEQQLSDAVARHVATRTVCPHCGGSGYISAGGSP